MISIPDNNIYTIAMFIAFFISLLYCLFNNKNNTVIILLSFIMLTPIIILSGLLFTYLFFNTKHLNIYQLGLSSMGCLIGYLVGIYILKIIINKININSYYLIIPLSYSIGKVGCFFHGCCRGFIYNGLLSVHYYNNEYNYFPIQLVESLAFIILFLILNKYKKNRNIEYITIMCFCLIKFILDYFRFSHNYFISINQLFALLIIFITIIRLRLVFKKN